MKCKASLPAHKEDVASSFPVEVTWSSRVATPMIVVVTKTGGRRVVIEVDGKVRQLVTIGAATPLTGQRQREAQAVVDACKMAERSVMRQVTAGTSVSQQRPQ